MLTKTLVCGKRPALNGHAVRRVFAVILMFALLVGGGIMALNKGNGSSRMEPPIVAPPGSANNSGAVPAPPTLNSPSKEYIYVGGRLVATEEPAP